MSTTSSAGAAAGTTNPHPIPLTESEVLIRGFLAANPDLDKGPIEMMTDRYTNEEWKAQIDETVKNVLKEVASGVRAKKVYEGPSMRNGEEALKQLAKTVDHTVLKLDATSTVIDGLCSEARTEGFKSVCVRLNWVQRCVSDLKGSDVLVACVVGFHEGTQDTYSKLREARAAVAVGAAELDVVLNHSLLTKHNRPASPPARVITTRDSAIDSITAANTAINAGSNSGSASGPDEDEIPDYSAIYRELASIRSLCPAPTTLKLILETSQLNSSQILAASHLAAAASFDFIKTSTGFNGPGANLPNVQLMVAAAEYLAAQRVGNKKMEVKASGGVRDLSTAIKMLEAGATRLGTSSGLWIMQEARAKVGEDKVAAGIGSDKSSRPSPGTRLYTDDSVY
ncbi:DeoC Deoxyribose-phosphate aldolase [Pyrenophora tritici-repentis]|uniref:deoxyribose-phosphate aldolase n=2 Tax=Pyrenophora tritici-repentis TaxID=45151 RepID=A0A2W1DTS2_9PLEO|nr:deoxyribose-phosphate aldolase [Pyrenophora tritici-repentis Pt-1C-BFP]KAA8614671.1 Deoxyribose-phosphate aldolase [Pyrenophora tritici-repentis]EDU50029.1 deoxyribose-phosphate aldolase [Pyrenophora tritici-repentis Pt-1C-BFP]KAF7444500.1 Deoxyribose-phosphate aldolase [Pyrenophora tritici-repentis]KAF7564845.1 DeoC, Deoxyribose-phosphate aldolase [Pyrenophora tritici-repentis]KAG9378740.1 Deoxyribose-phosphate aldolase [Pyrenophora tritici-repentis]